MLAFCTFCEKSWNFQLLAFCIFCELLNKSFQNPSIKSKEKHLHYMHFSMIKSAFGNDKSILSILFFQQIFDVIMDFKVNFHERKFHDFSKNLPNANTFFYWENKTLTDKNITFKHKLQIHLQNLKKTSRWQIFLKWSCKWKI